MTLLNEFCKEFGAEEAALGNVTRFGRDCYLTLPEQEMIIKEQKGLFGAGIFLGEEKRIFQPSPAIAEILAAKTNLHKAVVDEKAEWLFLCDRDIFTKGIKTKGEPTAGGFLLVQNERDENLGVGKSVKQGNVAIKNILDRGFFLRRER